MSSDDSAVQGCNCKTLGDGSTSTRYVTAFFEKVKLKCSTPLYDSKLRLLQPLKFLEDGLEVWLRGVHECPIHGNTHFYRVLDDKGKTLGNIQRSADQLLTCGNGGPPALMRAYADILFKECGDEGRQKWGSLLASTSWKEIKDMDCAQVMALFQWHGIERAWTENPHAPSLTVALYLRDYQAVAHKTVKLCCDEGVSVECIDLAGNELAVVSLRHTIRTAAALEFAVESAIAPASCDILLPDGRQLNGVSRAEPVRQALGLDASSCCLQ